MGVSVAIIRQILTTWQTPASSDGVSVMYFESGLSVNAQRNALAALWAEIGNGLSNQIRWTVPSEGVEIEDSTGTLTGTWSDGIPLSDVGEGAAQPVPDASQILLRWRSETVVNGRFLRGRTFIPGLTVSNMVSGNIGTTALGVFQAAVTDFIAEPSGLVIWHRPNGASPGSHDVATTGSVWSELAVLRRRRS